MVRRSTGISVMAAAIAAIVWLTRAGAGQGNPSGRIAYLSSRDGQSGIFLMNADGSGQRRLTTGPDIFHSWSPDGCSVVFRRTVRQIMIVGTDGTPPRLVVETNGGDPAGDLRAYASPDSSRIVFTGRKPGDITGTDDIWIVNADGSALTNLTRTPERYDYNDARWSPDGMRILFDINGGRGTWVMRSDGSARHQIATETTPSWWSSNTRLLALTPEGLKALEVVDPPLPRPTAPKPEAVRIEWSVSPDSSKLAFVSVRKDNTMSINVANRDFTGEKTVGTLSAQDIALYMAGPSSMPPSWSPDGSRLAFARVSPRKLPNGALTGGTDIFNVNADGSGLIQLTHDGQSTAPAWSSASTCR